MLSMEDYHLCLGWKKDNCHGAYKILYLCLCLAYLEVAPYNFQLEGFGMRFSEKVTSQQYSTCSIVINAVAAAVWAVGSQTDWDPMVHDVAATVFI